MKPIVPPPPPGPYPLRYNPLPDHTQLPDREGGKPLKPPPGPPPDHTQLPDKDGTFVKNSYEYWQSHLLTETILPVARRVYPGGNYFIGEDCGIYWRLTDPPARGVKGPDWFFIPEVPHLLNGQMRRSYVLWQEEVSPLIVLEYVSGDGTEERDRTPGEGKFWVYEHRLRAPYYGIFEPNTAALEMHVFSVSQYVRMQPNEHGRYPIPLLGVELGVWRGTYGDYDLPWLRWWDTDGVLLPTGEERADGERRMKDEALARAERLAARLRELGVDPGEA